MINVRLRKEDLEEYPDGKRYGVIRNLSSYSGYPLMVVDNSEEIKDGRYTRKPSKVLVHLSEDVRTYSRLRIFDDYLYTNKPFDKQSNQFNMFEYAKKELTDEEIIASLTKVLYFLEPSLQSRTLMGSMKKGIENDPNFYEGHYVLNDEKEYTILKHKDEYQFLRGELSRSHTLDYSDYLLEKGKIDFTKYKKALEMERLKLHTIMNVNQILSNDEDDTIERYQKLVKELK